ncbi:ComEC/Rec2 family competence protein, partial [Aquabacterium sp.]|uniref:ComEC/Rec2 family competence protein n=1 Tax=Aquabacterium sp. TaxID=1872578 RepID=UPI00345DCCBA
EVLHPGAQAYAHRDELSPNAISCVLKVSAAGRSALLTGDIESAQEAELVAQDANYLAGHLRSTVLIAAHHGSQTSSTAGFLQAVGPEQVVIQVGRRNRYGHPSPSVLARYESMRLNWVASPSCGAYIWFSDDADALVQDGTRSADQPHLGACWRPAHHRYWDQPSPMASLRPHG